MQIDYISIPEHKNPELFGHLLGSDDVQWKNSMWRRDITLLFETMDSVIFSDFRRPLDSSHRDNYRGIDFTLF
jgi:hypothetical protein